MKEIKITVTGVCGSGKSHVALSIAEHLQSLGFNVMITDDEYHSSNWELWREKAMKNLATGTNVSVVTQQANRNGENR